tara:strand:- start:251 stop:1240 length:990 start_codon:yes stop_codon:yes gene_type:complete
MAMYNVNMTSFEEVEKRYANIKPLGGRDNKGKDIRPIADRARKWESIRKISDSCYVLDDGDCFYSTWGHYTDKEKVQLAAIVWRRHKDGTETVTIRNGSGYLAHTSRYSFLDRFIPIGLRFECTYGKQFITNASSIEKKDNERIFLAKSNWYGKYLTDNRNLYGKRAQRDDGVALVFRRKSRPVNVLGWEFESGGKEIPRPPRTQVIKSLKAKHKKDLEELWTWMVAIQPVMVIGDYSHKWELERQYDKAADEIGYYQTGYMAKFSRAVLSDTKHPMRLNLAHKFLSRTKDHPDAWRRISIFEEATPQNVRARFNSWANTQFGFTKKVK